MYLSYNGVKHKDVAEMRILVWRIADLLGISVSVLAFIQTIGEWQSLILFSVSLIFFGYRIYMLHLDSEKKRLTNEEQAFDLYQKKNITAEVITNGGLLLSNDLSYFNEINTCVDNIFSSTRADRFLILIMHNGKTKKQYATVRFERHKNHALAYLSINAAERYKNFKFDEPYEKMITDSEHMPYVNMITEFMDDCLLKTIYTEEQVTHGEFYFISRQEITKEKDEIITCSVATHNGYFSPYENSIHQHNINIIRNRTKQLFN